MDGLSAASNVIAVISFAMKLAESVKKLYDFWESVEGAPQSINSTVDELKLLSDILAGYADMERVHGLSSSMQLALESCATHIWVLNAITTKFEDDYKYGSRARRKWAAFKVVLKAEKIMEFHEALSRAKTSLILANQHCTMTMIRADLEERRSWRTALMSQITIESKTPITRLGSWNTGQIEELNDGDTESFKESYLSPRTRKAPTYLKPSLRKRFAVSSSQSYLSSFFGNLSHQSQTFSTTATGPTEHLREDYEEKERTTESLLVIRPALWLAYLGINCELRLALSQSPGKWTHTLNTFRPVADDSLIFEFCKTGNVDGVKLLLEKGDASIWDTNSEGHTPLQVAASYIEPRLCQVLLDAGADAETRDNHNRSCFNLACEDRTERSYENTAQVMQHVKKIDVLRLFLYQTDLTEVMDSKNLSGRDWWSLRNLVQREHTVPGTYKSTPSAFAWIIRILKNEIQENIRSDLLDELTLQIKDKWNITDIKSLLADIITPRYVMEGGFTPLHLCSEFQDFNTAPSLKQQHENLYSAKKDVYWSNPPESLTSMSLYSSTTFADWRETLLEKHISFKEFVAKELQNGVLKTHGWTEETLLKLFRLDYKSEMYPGSICECCQLPVRKFSFVETPWQRALQRIRAGQDACYSPKYKMPSSGNEVTQPSNNGVSAEPCPQISRAVHEEDTPETIHYLHQSFEMAKPSFQSRKTGDWLGEYRFCWQWLCIDCWKVSDHSPIKYWLDSETSEDEKYTKNTDNYENDNDVEDTSNDDSPILLSINL